MKDKHQEDLSHIRLMMERSSRFISLSGLSGIAAGITALVGTGVALCLFQQYQVEYVTDRIGYPSGLLKQLVCIAILVLLISLLSGIYFTVSKSKKKGLKIWTTTTKNLLINLAIPLISGGIFCIALMYYKQFAFIAPSTLVFYGLSLVNASKYTYNDIYYLGVCEIVLGLTAMFTLGNGLIFWAIGFGCLHIIYGIMMYKKYP